MNNTRNIKKTTQKVQFNWKAIDSNGKQVKGEIQSIGITQAKSQLLKRGLIKIKITKKSNTSISFFGDKILPEDLTLLTRQLATMLKAGMPIIKAFDIARDGMDKKVARDLINTIKTDVEQGSTLSNAFERHPQYFDKLYCSLIAAGESSGALELLLDRIASFMEKSQALKNKIKKAMYYPVAVICVAVVVTGILLIKVVPQFEGVFKSFGAQLPAFTQMVIDLSEFMQAYWFNAIILGFIVSYVFKKLLASSPKLQRYKDAMVLKLPIIGKILEKSIVARFGRTLATTFAAGVPLINALQSTAGSSGNIIYSSAIEKIKNEVSSGQPLYKAMKDSQLFPRMAVQLVSVGEESGTLATMLDKFASLYEEEVDEMVDGLTSLIEPIIMSILGILVGGLIVAMYLPIFQLGSVV